MVVLIIIELVRLGVRETVNRIILGWLVLLAVIVLFSGCGEGVSVKGESADGDDTTDDDTAPTEPPPPPIDCWREMSDLSVILLGWQYDYNSLGLVDKFIIKRRGGSSQSFETIGELEPDKPIQYYQDDSAECETSYAYRIYASNAAGESEPCGPIVATRQCE